MAKLAWKKDKFDKRDYLHMMLPPKAVPDVVILDKYLPSIRDQGNVGSCVGFGVGVNLTFLAKKLKVYTEWFSPTWIYNGARFIDGNLSQDVGAYPRDALEWIRSKGCLLEHFWPYNPSRVDISSPSSNFNSEAVKYPIVSYFRVTGGIDAICSAISQSYYVSIGSVWFDKWMNPPGGVLPSVNADDSIAGGHETCLYGYDKTKQIFYGINSWGTGWGNKGLYTMPFSSFSVFNKLGGYDAHYINVAWPVVVAPSKIKKVKLLTSQDNGSTWTTVYETAFSTSTQAKKVKLATSQNNGVSWVVLYEKVV